MGSGTRLTSTLTGAALALTAWVAAPAAVGANVAAASPQWAPATSAKVHPGMVIEIASVKCIVGFVLTDGTRVFLAIPASCTGVSAGQPPDGCSEAQVPVGLPITVPGAQHKGRLVYSSFTQMQLSGETRANRCAANNMSLIRLDARDVRRTNPSVPLLGGPTGVAWTAPAEGDQLHAYIKTTATAVAMQAQRGGWAEQILPATQVSATDVGSPVLTDSGRALGMVSIVQQIQGGPITVSRLDHELAYLHLLWRFRSVHLARGTTKFGSPVVGGL
jgi:hypothetical protein